MMKLYNAQLLKDMYGHKKPEERKRAVERIMGEQLSSRASLKLLRDIIENRIAKLDCQMIDQKTIDSCETQFQLDVKYLSRMAAKRELLAIRMFLIEDDEGGLYDPGSKPGNEG